MWNFATYYFSYMGSYKWEAAIKHFIERSSVTFTFQRGKKCVPSGFSVLNCNHKKKKNRFFWWKDFCTPKLDLFAKTVNDFIELLVFIWKSSILEVKQYPEPPIWFLLFYKYFLCILVESISKKKKMRKQSLERCSTIFTKGSLKNQRTSHRGI